MSNKEKPSIEVGATLLSHLLYAGQFRVPWHQRRYDWRKEHVEELLRDINEAVGEARVCYFLGAVMLVKKADKVWEINDGQQRMVTFSLICAALCRLFSDRGDSLREHLALRNLFVLNQNHTQKLADADELEPRFSPPQNDKTRYDLLIRRKNIGANGKLTAAWQVIDGFFHGIGEEKTCRFFDFLMQKIEVAALYIPVEVDPNSVYETLNCRGKKLDDLDMLRNHLYSYFNSDQEKIRRDTVHNSLERMRQILKDGQKSAEYARCFFQCKFGFLPKDRLYRATKSQIKAEIEKISPPRSAKTESDYIYELSEEFCFDDRVEIFRTITSPSENDFLIGKFNSDCKKSAAPRGLFLFLRELQTYKVAQPIVFALLNCYARETDGRKRKSLANAIMTRMKLLTAFVMRTAFSAPKFETSHFESEFSNLAQKILSANSLDKIDFANYLKECDENGVTDDKKFVDTLSRVQMRDSKKAKRFLLGLVYFEQPANLIISEHRCSVEHILPKSKAHWADWGKFDADQHSDSVHMLGNLTLLGDQENKPGAAANRNFSLKKEIYKKSGISLTRGIANKYDDWSPDNIVERQKQMAETAVRVWPFAAFKCRGRNIRGRT